MLLIHTRGPHHDQPVIYELPQDQGATLAAGLAEDVGCVRMCSGQPLGPLMEHKHQRWTMTALTTPTSGYLPPLDAGPLERPAMGLLRRGGRPAAPHRM